MGELILPPPRGTGCMVGQGQEHMPEYVFESTWRIAAPIEAVWEAIYHSENWPTWWREVERVDELVHGGDDGVGNIRRYLWKTRLPYKLAFEMRATRVQRPTLLEGVATGELNGVGRWRLQAAGDVTVVQYTWQVRTTKWWMNLLAPLARPLFKWNHQAVLRGGAQGLARLLRAPLLSVEER